MRAGPLAAAIAAGNTVLLKPSELAPETSAVLKVLNHCLTLLFAKTNKTIFYYQLITANGNPLDFLKIYFQILLKFLFVWKFVIICKQEAMESFAIPVRNEKSVKIDERFLSSDKGNILP